MPGDSDAAGGGRDAAKAKTVGEDDAIVEDVVDVGFGGEAAHGGSVVFRGGGLGGCDADVLVALGEARAGGGDAGFSVSGDGGVSINDQVAVGCDAGHVDLGAGGCCSDGHDHRKREKA